MSKAYDYFREISANNNDMIMPNDTDITDDSGRIHDATGISDGVGGFLANLLMPVFSTALYRPSVQNFIGGLEGVAGGAANYLGAFAKSQGEIDPDTGWNSLGDWLTNNGKYWNDRANDVQQQFGTLNRYQNEDILQRLTDTDYLTDSRGLMADVFNGAGSAAPFVVASSLAPEIGIGGALARGAGGLLERLGMSTAGRAVASDLVQSGANDFARYALTSGPLEAAINAGGIYDDLKNQGLSDSEIFGKMNDMIGEELPMDMLTSGLYGAVLGGNTFSRLGQGGWKRAIGANILNTPADMLGEYVQEMTQQQLQNKYSGKPYGTFWNPTEDEMQAGRAAAMGTLPMGLFGSARGAMHSRRAAMAAEGGGSVTGPEPVTPPAVPDPDVDPVEAAQLTGKNDDVPTADGVDVTELDPQQYTQWYDDKLKTQGINVPDATITVQTPKATGTTGGAKAGAGANVMDAAQDFMGQHMENGANGCVEAVTKIGARYNPFLADELSKGVVNVDTLVSDAGDKVIPFDPNNLEAGDVIVYGDNDHVVLADGNGGYVGNSSSQQKVVQGGDYNNMGGLKPTKIIKTGNGVTAQNETANNGGAPAADLSSLPVGDIATAIAQNTGLPANFIWAQLSHESDGGNSKLAREDHNYGGVKGNDGEYLHFDNDQQFIDYMSNYYPKYREDGIYDAQTADQFAEALQHGGYFTADLGEYEGGMHRYLEQAGLSDNGTAGAPAEKQSTVNTMTQQQFGDMLNEKMIDFAGTNDDTVKTVFNDMSTSKDKALVSLFAPYMQDGVFANTAANRTALVNNDGFKKAMAMFLSKHLSDYAPAFENGKISFQQAEEALRPRHQVQAAQTAQAVQATQTPNIKTAVTPQALIHMVQSGLNRTQQGALLQAADTALHTPQGMANGDEAIWMNRLAKAIDEHDYPTIAKMIPNEAAQALSLSSKANSPSAKNALESTPRTANKVRMPDVKNAMPSQDTQDASSIVQMESKPLNVATAPNSPVRPATVEPVNTSVAQIFHGTDAGRMNVPTQVNDDTAPESIVAPQEEQRNDTAAPVSQEPQAAPKAAVVPKADVTPLPRPSEQQSEGVRIAQPQQTIDEQNAQTDARIAEIEKTPLAQRKALGQQYLDTLRQNNVPFSEKKLAKPLMNGNPKAIEHVQRTYGDLLNTITPAEAAAASQHAPRTIQAVTTARLGNMVSEITSGNTYKNASPVGKLAYLSAASAHAKTIGADKSARAIDSIIADVRKKAGFSGKGTTEGMTPEQKDEFYNAFYKQSLDDATAIRKEAADEKPANLKSLDNTIEMFKQELAKSKPTKEERKEDTHESTQSKNQQKPDEGTKNQDQHAKPEPRKAADTQRKAEESEVSATKKAADKGGRDEQTLSEKEVVLKHISTLFGKPITNKETGIVATFGTKGANKMVSNKAVDKTVKNGYSQHEHLEAVKDIKRLYEDAGLSVQHEDRDKSPNILSIKRFRTNMTTVDGNPATAKITVKETKQNGHKIYSIELEALEKPSELNHARADSSEGQTVRPTKGKQPSSAYADESSSSTHIIPHEQKEGTKNLDSAKVPAMGEPIHGIKGAETTVVTDSGKEIRVRYLVVPASRVITSHNAETMTPNKAYPQELQPRDRQRVSTQEQVTSMANELRPADLGAGRNLNQGAPIIRKDGVVLNGNGRAMAIQKATAAGGDKATAYRKYIFEHSKEFGLSRVNLAQVRKYMLVREVVDDIDADTMQDIIGSPGRMRRALVKLGLSTEQLKNVELRQAKGKQLDDINGWDMLAKSVRQVARKSPAVQYIYRLGRKALDEQEHLRNFYAQEIRKFNQYVKNPKILEEVAQLLWEGDATGHAYTGDELQAMGVSVEAGRAYNLVRRVLADAYKRVNEARMQVKVRTEVIGRNDYREFIASHFLKPEDVLKAEMLRNGSMRVTYRGAKVYSKNEEVVSSEVYNRLRKDKDVYVKYADANEDGTYTIGYTERVKPIHKLEGYMPHFFHHFMVYEKTKGDDGKEILVSLGSANSLKKATDLANQYAKANPESQFVIRPHSFEYDEDYNNVVVGDKDYMKMMLRIMKHTEMTLTEANAFLHDSVGVTKKGRHRFFGNAQHRKGAKGFDQDVQWALTHYLNASARYVAMEHFKPEAIGFYERFFGDFNAEPKSNTARYIKNFINDMNGVPSYIEDELNKIVANIPFFGSRLNDAFEGRPALALSSSISWFNAVTKLGLGNFASAAINFMQFINIGTRLNSYAYANMGLKKALKPSDFDRRIIEESGVMDEVNLASDAGGYTQTRDYGRARKGLSKVKKGLDLAMIPFTKADSLMRKAAILGAYYQGVQEKGMKPEHEGEISRKAIEYAKDVNYDANFDYSTAAAPGAMRAGSVLTQQLFQFQKYPIMQFEFFWNNVVHAKNNKQRARFLVPYLLMSGAVGAVPFGALINAVASSLVGAGGDDDNDLAEEIKAEMMKWAGTDPMKRRLVNTVLYGILANANINISERVGMSNAFSGEYYGNKPQSSAGALLQLFGGPLVSTVYNVATQIGNHNPIETIKAVSPSLGNMLQAVVGETRTTHHRVGTVYEDMYSRVMHALGFRSVDETNNSFVNSYLYKQQKQEQEDRKDAMDAYIRNPSSENHQRMVDLGIKDSTFKTYKENANKSSKERSQGEKKTKSKKPQTASQKEDERLKGFTK